MSLVKRGALIKNERLKLYKKPSTWVLMGVIVLMTLLNLLFTRIFIRSYESFNLTWQDQYSSQIENMTRELKSNPDDAYIKQTLDTLKFLLENEIEPTDWRTDVAIEYYSIKHGMTESEIPSKPNTQIQPPAGTEKSDDEIKNRLEKLDSLLKNNDWKAFVNLQIKDLKSGITPATNEQEKQVDIEMYELYLERNIIPVAQKSNYYYHGSGSGFDNITWKNRQVQSIRENKLNLVRGETTSGVLLTRAQRKNIENQIAVSLKRLSTNTPPITYDSFLGMLEGTSSSLSLLSILLIVYAGNIFASEYGSGTIKLLLITPHRRKKIFWAKVLLMLELTAIALVLIFALAFLISGAFTGFKGIASMQVLPLFGRIIHMPYLLYIALRFLLMLLPVIAYGALAMMMSVVTRKSAVAIAVTMLIMFGSNILMTILTALSGRMVVPGIKFLLFANTQIENYLPSAQSVFNIGMPNTVDATMTLGFSLAVLAIYAACFLWIARDSFCRRDVK